MIILRLAPSGIDLVFLAEKRHVGPYKTKWEKHPTIALLDNSEITASNENPLGMFIRITNGRCRDVLSSG